MTTKGKQIRIDEEVKAWLDDLKVHPRQSYNEVLRKVKTDGNGLLKEYSKKIN